MAGQSANLSMYLIGLLVIVTMSTGMNTMFVNFGDNYGLQRTDLTFQDDISAAEVRDITEELSDNVRETGIEDESSNTKITSVGWSSYKLFLRSPGIFNRVLGNLSRMININVAGVDVVSLGVVIIIISVVWTLIYSLFFGRS